MQTHTRVNTDRHTHSGTHRYKLIHLILRHGIHLKVKHKTLNYYDPKGKFDINTLTVDALLHCSRK